MSKTPKSIAESLVAAFASDTNPNLTVTLKDGTTVSGECTLDGDPEAGRLLIGGRPIAVEDVVTVTIN